MDQQLSNAFGTVILCMEWNELRLIFSLLDKGRQILMKDDLIDEERARQEEAAQETLQQKIDRLGQRYG